MDLIVAVLHGNTYESNQERRDPYKSPTRKKNQGKIDDLNKVDFSSKVHSSHQEALLYVFEENEAVIKMIIKGRSPTMRHVPEPTELLLIGCLIESIWTPRSKSKYTDTKNPTRRHIDEGKFHTWWMESSFVFVQHQPFQFHQLSWSDVEKNTRRCRWRNSHSKIKADDELGLAIQRKGSDRACLDCIGKPGENQFWKSESTSVLLDWAATKNGETCDGR